MNRWGHLAAALLVTLLINSQASAQAARLWVSASVDQETYYPWEPIVVSLSAYNPWSVPVTIAIGCGGGLGYVMDDAYSYPPPTDFECDGYGYYTLEAESYWTATVRHDWDGYYPQVGSHALVGDFHPYEGWVLLTLAPPVTFDILAPPTETGDVYIDFQTVPGGGDPGAFAGLVSEGFLPWGVSFTGVAPSEYSSTGFCEPQVTQNGDNLYLTVNTTSYPPGFNIIAHLDNPAYMVSVDVETAQGRAVTMVAKDANGNVLTSVTSAPLPSHAFTGPLMLSADTPIHSLEWWPSEPNASVSIDNLFLVRSPRKLGDADGDGDVDLDDFTALKASFGITYTGDHLGCDFDGDRTVDLDDFLVIKQHFGANAQ